MWQLQHCSCGTARDCPCAPFRPKRPARGPEAQGATDEHRTGEPGATAGRPRHHRPRQRLLQPDRARSSWSTPSRAAKATSARAAPSWSSTGIHTGRSPKDKFVVRTPDVEDTIWWDNNKPMDPAPSNACTPTCSTHMKGRDLLRAGSLRRRRSGPPARRALRHRAGLAHAVHPPHAAPARRATSSTSFVPEFTIINTALASRPTRNATAAAPRR